MPNTTRIAAPYPASSAAADVPADIQALATLLDGKMAMDTQGTLAGRPTPGAAETGRYYFATDNLLLYRWNGTTWITVNPAQAVDAAAGVGSLRTLGTGALQAAPGNDARFTTPVLPSGLKSARPAGVAGNIYYATDVGRLYFCTAPSTWTDLGVPCGSIVGVPTLTPADAFWLYCNGQAVSRTTYADLFAKLGVTQGSGNGTTTFNVPDLRGRVLMGAVDGSGRIVVGAAAVGSTGGEELHTLTTAEMPSHVHTTNATAADNSGALAPGGGSFHTSLAVAAGTGSTGGDGSHNTLQPYQAEAWHIRV